MRFTLDDVDITSDIQAQTPISNSNGGIYPNIGTKWYNLIPIVQNHPELSDFFSKGGLRVLKVIDQEGKEFNVKIILRLAYSARNS